jgi:hypothetical protein
MLKIDGKIAAITAGWQEREAEDQELQRRPRHHRSRQPACSTPAARPSSRHDPELFAAQPRQAGHASATSRTCTGSAPVPARWRPPGEVHQAAAPSSAGRGRARPRPSRPCACSTSSTTPAKVRQVAARSSSASCGRSSARPCAADCGTTDEHPRRCCASVMRCSSPAATSRSLLQPPAPVPPPTRCAPRCHRPLPVFAWSAGAMAVTDRVVLFHDSPPAGPPATPRSSAHGLGLFPGVVALPHARRRLRLEGPRPRLRCSPAASSRRHSASPSTSAAG